MTDELKCPDCGGEGWQWYCDVLGEGDSNSRKECPTCKGTGKVQACDHSKITLKDTYPDNGGFHCCKKCGAVVEKELLEPKEEEPKERVWDESKLELQPREFDCPSCGTRLVAVFDLSPAQGWSCFRCGRKSVGVGKKEEAQSAKEAINGFYDPARVRKTFEDAIPPKTITIIETTDHTGDQSSSVSCSEYCSIAEGDRDCTKCEGKEPKEPRDFRGEWEHEMRKSNGIPAQPPPEWVDDLIEDWDRLRVWEEIAEQDHAKNIEMGLELDRLRGELEHEKINVRAITEVYDDRGRQIDELKKENESLRAENEKQKVLLQAWKDTNDVIPVAVKLDQAELESLRAKLKTCEEMISNIGPQLDGCLILVTGKDEVIEQLRADAGHYHKAWNEEWEGMEKKNAEIRELRARVKELQRERDDWEKSCHDTILEDAEKINILKDRVKELEEKCKKCPTYVREWDNVEDDVFNSSH